jgi:hypothetical protein
MKGCGIVKCNVGCGMVNVSRDLVESIYHEQNVKCNIDALNHLKCNHINVHHLIIAILRLSYYSYLVKLNLRSQ